MRKVQTHYIGKVHISEVTYMYNFISICKLHIKLSISKATSTFPFNMHIHKYSFNNKPLRMLNAFVKFLKV